MNSTLFKIACLFYIYSGIYFTETKQMENIVKYLTFSLQFDTYSLYYIIIIDLVQYNYFKR